LYLYFVEPPPQKNATGIFGVELTYSFSRGKDTPKRLKFSNDDYRSQIGHPTCKTKAKRQTRLYGSQAVYAAAAAMCVTDRDDIQSRPLINAALTDFVLQPRVALVCRFNGLHSCISRKYMGC